MYHNDAKKETMLQEGPSSRANTITKIPCAEISVGGALSIPPSSSNCPEMNNKQAFRSPRNCPSKKLFLMKLSPKFYVFTYEARAKLYVAEEHHDC
jgi:hypothetical protein